MRLSVALETFLVVSVAIFLFLAIRCTVILGYIQDHLATLVMHRLEESKRREREEASAGQG